MGTKVFMAVLFVAASTLPLACVDDSDWNYTEEESRATNEQTRAGTLRLKLLDATTGKPATKCIYNSYRFSFDEEKVKHRGPVFVSWEAYSEASDGIHKFQLAEGYWILGIWAEGYQSQETEAFKIRYDETIKLTMGLEPSKSE